MITVAFLAVAVIVAGTWLYLSFVDKFIEPDKRISNDLGMAFVYISLGTFTMGSPEDEPGRRVDYETQHQVSLTQGFYMQTTEVTQGQWRKVMNDNPFWLIRRIDTTHATIPQIRNNLRKINQKLGKKGWKVFCRCGWSGSILPVTIAVKYFIETI